uniref:Uncharacterized protein n=1 Tax=Populus trichocarpa TaxID=3694 RepID=A0A3N7G1C9_POPTR
MIFPLVQNTIYTPKILLQNQYFGSSFVTCTPIFSTPSCLIHSSVSISSFVLSHSVLLLLPAALSLSNYETIFMHVKHLGG